MRCKRSTSCFLVKYPCSFSFLLGVYLSVQLCSHKCKCTSPSACLCMTVSAAFISTSISFSVENRNWRLHFLSIHFLLFSMEKTFPRWNVTAANGSLPPGPESAFHKICGICFHLWKWTPQKSLTQSKTKSFSAPLETIFIFCATPHERIPKVLSSV